MTTHVWIATLKHITCSDHYLVVAPTKEEAIDKAATATDIEKSKWTARQPCWIEGAENEVAWLYEN